MSDEDNVIDVEAEEIPDSSDNLPAVVPMRTTEDSGQTHEHTEPISKWSEEWWAAQAPHTQARRCRAHSSRTGEPCKNLAIQGSTCCRFHGGAAKHVKAAARARLENAADVMAKQLLTMALTADSESVALAAIKDALDRGGLKPPAEVVLSQGETKPWEELFDGISVMSREESRAARGYAGVDTGSDGNSTDAGRGVPRSPATSYDSRPVADEYNTDPPPATAAQAYGQSGPPRQARRPDFDRERDAQPPVTGADALRIAGQLARQKAIESPHKRYPHP